MTSPPPPGPPEPPLIPILRVEEGLGDPVALATWHEALSNTLGVDVPHDLLGLWLFPAHGKAVLLGPAALAQDHLAVPIPAPYLHPAELGALEKIVRNAGYGSVLALPIRFGRRDVGLLLAADLHPERYGEAEQALLRWAAQRLAPMFGRLARLWITAADGSATRQLERTAALVDAVGAANVQAESPQLFAHALSRALEWLVPHDHLELLVPDAAGERCFRLGEHSGGPLWADPSLVIDRGLLDLPALFSSSDTLLVADSYADARWPRGFLTAAEPAGAELRGLVGARIPGEQGTLAYVLLGSVGPDLYGVDDAALLTRIANLVRPRIEGFLSARVPHGMPTSRDAAPSAEPAPSAPMPRDPWVRIAELLATTTDVPGALYLAVQEAGLIVPFERVHGAIRLTDGDRVVLMEPGERRPLPDLPLIPVAGTPLAQVLHGEVPDVRDDTERGSRLIVPLRVAGRVHGALIFTSPRRGVFGDDVAARAQRVADLLAPHFELLRRAALLPPPYVPGWKRSGERGGS